MLKFAENGNRILFIENTGLRPPVISDLPRIKKRIFSWIRSTKGFRKEGDNIYLYSPLILPFPYSRIARMVNRRLVVSALKNWINCTDFYEPIIWTFLPTPLCLDIVNNISHISLIYYNIDNLSETSAAAHKIINSEKEIVRKADVVFVMSRAMQKYFLSFSSRVVRIAAGVNVKIFSGISCEDSQKPAELASVRNKIVGYVGGVRKSIDIGLIEYLASHLNNFTFVFVGPVQINLANLKKYNNIIFTGQKRHESLPLYIKNFDVCIIPYKKDGYSDNISPAKLNEYLILGKPVVSTYLEEVANFNKEHGDILSIARDYPHFAMLVSESIEQDSDLLKKRRMAVAHDNSWDNKIEEMSLIIEDIIKSRRVASLSWQTKLLKIYKEARSRFLAYVFSLALAWIILFYTPFIWFLANPLKISHASQPSDCIVVFAAGVGESGKAGQGYEERVQQAVALYKEGYAKNMIFSSGYTYVFKEAEIMKTLTVSLGIPEGAIILEEKATNTYENVRFVNDILKGKRWNRILLVTSPYNMLRATLVFKKNAPGIKVICSPIANSRFYMRRPQVKGNLLLRQANIEQIKGIIHEYLGIIYYWSKGWI